MQLWRINLKPANAASVDPRERCITNKIVGIGWPLGNREIPKNKETYYDKAWRQYKNVKKDKGWKGAADAICHKMQIDDLVWTRTLDGVYYIGRVTSDWRYDSSEEAHESDILNIRDCDWDEVGTAGDVPGKIATSFMGQTLRKVNGAGLAWFSKLAYNRLCKNLFFDSSDYKIKNIFDFLLPDEVEDIAALYLQKQGWYILPSTSKSSTSHYEFEMIHSITGQAGFLQVKNGVEDLYLEKYTNKRAHFYLFTTAGRYIGSPQPPITCLLTKDIEAFINNDLTIMPPSVRKRIEYCRSINLV